MKKAVLLLSVFLFLMQGTPVFAQIVDMRAYSRQHGFKAYQKKQVRLSRRVVAREREQNAFSDVQTTSQDDLKSENGVLVQQAASEKKQNKKSKSVSDQTDEMRQYIENNPQVVPDI